jgi:hypothetical protein
MKTHEAIDLEKQLADLLRQESMLAFFDFTLPLPGRGPASGIAKIAKPRKGKSRARYLAVLFIVDTPSLAARQAVSAALTRMNWQSLAEGGLPGCRSVIPIPYVNAGSDLYFLEADLYLDDGIEPTEDYLEDQVMPALARVTRLKAGELAMWDEAPKPAGPAASLFARLRKLFA